MYPHQKHNPMNPLKEIKESYNNVISILHDYMYDEAFFSDLVLNAEKEQKNKYVDTHLDTHTHTQKQELVVSSVLETNSRPKPPAFFYPREKDALFWCFYIMKYGFEKYEEPNARSFIHEKNMKFKCIEELREKKQLLKTHKVKNIKEDIEDELANKEQITMKTFIALCIAENMNILFIHKKKCFEIVMNPDSSAVSHVVHCIDPVVPVVHVVPIVPVTNEIEESVNLLPKSKSIPLDIDEKSKQIQIQKQTHTHKYKQKTKYCYELHPSTETIQHYREKYFKWESLDKPIRSMTSYKLAELQELYKKINPLDKDTSKDTNKDTGKKTKKELYEYIVSNI